MIQKTTDYHIFKLRDDNRECIGTEHVKRLVGSISARNMLEFRPISVNKEMEVLDGQHRLMAAKELQIPIYYEINENLESRDIITMNIAKSWTKADYLNYYVKNGFEQYIKLNEFIKKNQIALGVAFGMSGGQNRQFYYEFKIGKYVFFGEEKAETLSVCRETIVYIRRMNAGSPYKYLNSARFWGALMKLCSYETFDAKKWNNNLAKMVEKCSMRTSQKAYYKMLRDIYNWRNVDKIDNEENDRD